MAEITKLEPRRKRAKCPVCGKAPDAHFRPFCSKRCADIDLGRWLGGGYRIETEERSGEDNPPGDAPMEGEDSPEPAYRKNSRGPRGEGA